MGIILGYHIFNLFIFRQKLLIRCIHFSILIVLIGIFYQILFHGPESFFMNRLYGITGEPKALGLYFVPYIIALYVSSTHNSFNQFVMLLISICIVLLTKSPTVFIGLMLLILIISNNKTLFRIYNKKFIITFLTAIFIITLFNNYFDFYATIVERISLYLNAEHTELQAVFSFPIIGAVTVEGNDYPVHYFFGEHPLYIISGIGLGQESIYTFGYVDDFGPFGFVKPYFKGYITPNFALLTSTSNFGLLFVIILFYWGFKTLQSRTYNLTKDEIFLFYFFLSHFFISLLIFRSAVPLSTSIIVLGLFFNSIGKKN